MGPISPCQGSPDSTSDWKGQEQMGTYIWLEGRVQHACFQPPEVEVLEEGVFLHFPGPSSSAPQALQRVFAQEL